MGLSQGQEGILENEGREKNKINGYFQWGTLKEIMSQSDENLVNLSSKT